MPLSGNGQEGLRELLKGLQAVASKRYLRQMTSSLGAEMLALVKGGFDTSTSPDGAPWRPVLRGGLPLRKTGRLRNAWTVKKEGGTVGLENNLIQALMMQHGTAGLPGGKLTPKTKRALSFDTPGAKKKRARGGSSWVPTTTVKSVVIPARPMVPNEGELPERWERRLRDTAETVMELVLKAKGE